MVLDANLRVGKVQQSGESSQVVGVRVMRSSVWH